MEETVTNTSDVDALYSTLGEVYCSLDLSITVST